MKLPSLTHSFPPLATLLRSACAAALASLGLCLLPAVAAAQDLLVVDYGRTLWRVTGSGAVTTTAIAGLASTEVIVGAKRNFELQLPSGTGVPVIRIVTYDEISGVTSAYKLDLSGSTPTATNGCAVQNGSWSPNVWPVVGYGSNLNEFVPPNPFTALVDDGGYVYAGPSCAGSPGAGTQLAFTPSSGVISGTTVYQNDLLVMKYGSSTVLSRVHYPNTVPFGGGPPSITQTWSITDQVGMNQILGITVDCSGHLWACVNRPIGCSGHATGDYILARSAETLSSSTLTLNTYQDIGDWSNLIGCYQQPKFLFFDLAAPSGLALAGPTSVVGCQSATLTPHWDGGPATGTVNPGAISVQNGVAFSVTPGVGQVKTYTLTVAGLTCVNGTATHTVTSNALAIGTPAVSDSTPCAESAVSFSAPVTNVGANPVFTWKRWNGTSAGATVATGNPSSPFVTATSDDGQYVLVVSDACGTAYTSAPVALDVQFPADVGVPSGGGATCVGQSATLSFPVSGQPLPQWKLWSGGTLVQSGTATSGTVTYVTPPVTGQQIYELEAWNECNGTEHALSAEVIVTRAVGPQLVTSPPTSVQRCAGESLALSASATGDAPLAYEWTRDGTLVGSGPTLSIPATVVGDTGNYRVRVTNPASTICGDAQAFCAVTVVGTPSFTHVAAGTDTSGVALSWSATNGAGSYVLYRADNPLGTGTVVLSQGSGAVSYFDTNAIPGHSYYYSVGAATDAAGSHVCHESGLSEGWRALSPPALNSTYTFPQSYAVLSWTPVTGAGFYRVYRRGPGESVFTPLSPWTSATTLQVTGNSFETYDFAVTAAIDPSGTHESAQSNVFPQAMPCQQAGQLCGTPASPGLLVLIDRSRHMLLPTANGTRWNDAVLYAHTEVAAFFGNCPSGSVAIWTFAGGCVEDLTSGFVSQAEANVVLDALPPLPSDTLGAPLANAMCTGILSMCSCVPGGGACTIPTPGGARDKIMLVLTAGTNDPLAPGGSFCDGPDATSGSNCTTAPFLPVNSWPRKFCNLLTGVCPTLYAQVWSTPLSLRTDDPSVLGALAARSGGLGRMIHDGDPLPDPFFGDCNHNTLPDALDIQAGTSADCNQDGVPDECQHHLDCNGNGRPDSCDLADGTSADRNFNGRADECEGFALTPPVLPLAGVHDEFHVIGGTPRALVLVYTSAPGWIGGLGGGHGGWTTAPRVRQAQVPGLQVLDAHGHRAFLVDVPAELGGSTIQFWARELGSNRGTAGPIAVTFH